MFKFSGKTKEQTETVEKLTDNQALKHTETKRLKQLVALDLSTRRNLMGYWFILPFAIGLLCIYIPSVIEAFRFSISDIIKELPMPKKRKYTLNFAVTSKSNLDVSLMNKYFDKEKCIVKMTPIHRTVEAVNERYEIVNDFDVYEKFEQPLVNDGWEVIVFVPSKEEDEDRITCGNSLIAIV